MSFAVMGTGSYVPPRVVTNEELSQFVDTTDEWITQRVGVKQRYVCTTETAAECVRVFRDYLTGAAPEGTLTRGLYERGVE